MSLDSRLRGNDEKCSTRPATRERLQSDFHLFAKPCLALAVRGQIGEVSSVRPLSQAPLVSSHVGEAERSSSCEIV